MNAEGTEGTSIDSLFILAWGSGMGALECFLLSLSAKLKRLVQCTHWSKMESKIQRNGAVKGVEQSRRVAAGAECMAAFRCAKKMLHCASSKKI